MTSLAFSAARTALAAQLAAKIPSLHVSATVPALINVPAAIVAPASGQLADFEQVISSDLVAWYVRIVLLVGNVKDDASQGVMDALLSTSGAMSVPAAIRADPTLGGQVEWAELKTASRYGSMSWNGVDYLGTELSIEISC